MLKTEKLDETVDALVSWIKGRVADAGATGAVFGLSGGADSALVALLCKRAFPDNSVGVLMPCHSSISSLNRADELAAKIGLKTFTVSLSDAWTSIVEQTGQSPAFNAMNDNKMAKAALRSCLRAPALDFVAKLNNALIIGTGNRDEDEVTRYFQKRGDGAVDISPIAKLHKSEVYQLLKHLDCPKSIVDAVPSADLWGPNSGQEDEKELGLTYPEIEWAIQENDKSDRFFDEYVSIPRAVLDYTPRQLEVMKKLMAMEKASRHKAEKPPVFEIRHEFDFFVE